jgi:hypothetical protein
VRSCGSRGSRRSTTKPATPSGTRCSASSGTALEDGPGVTKELKIDDDGDVFVEHCACPICQASLHGVTVVEAVEQMYKNDLIPHQAIETMRARAKHLDSHQEMRKKMLN